MHYSLGTTLSFSMSTFNVNENEGPAQPELALSVAALFDINVFITSVNVHLAGKLFIIRIVTVHNVCMYAEFQDCICKKISQSFDIAT